MTRPRLEVAEVIRSCRDAFLQQYGAILTTEQRRALDDLISCRTAALGGHVLECLECGHQEVSYNSCGNRHCPKCQATAAAQWLEAQAADLLETPYFHVVFTLPNALDPVALHPRVVYSLLMRAAAEILLEVAANPKHLGAEVGVLAVLHTWGQTLRCTPMSIALSPAAGWCPRRAVGSPAVMTSSCRSASSDVCSGASSSPGSASPSSGDGFASPENSPSWVTQNHSTLGVERCLIFDSS